MASRGSLEAALEAQREQLAQYRARLRDVVAAYKALLAERDALRAALQALAPPPGEPEEPGEPGEPGEEAEEAGSSSSGLAAAVWRLAEVRARAEASFQAERRRLRREAAEARERLAETTGRLAAQQRDRAQEQADHADMLRELQRLLQAERARREEAEREAPPPARREQEEEEEEQEQEEEALRSHFHAQLLQERRKTAQAEERVQMEEQRVTSLEVQMSEVSELLGTYEKAKQKDQMTIQKLKDRVAQLDLENKTLAMAASGRSPLDVPLEENNLDINVLREKMEKLQQLVQAAAKRGQCPLALEDFCLPELPKGTEPGDGEKASAAYYQQELKQLKEEFERYKLRAQVVLKNKSAKDGSLAKELEGAQEQLAELKEKYVSLRLSCEAVEKQHREELEAKKQELSRLQQLHRQELERGQAACREKILKVEEEMHKQRDRALAVLAEKDQELEQLRTVVLPSDLQGAKKALRPSPQAGPSSQDPLGAESLETLTQALRLTAPGEPGFLLYTEQLARKEVAVAALQKEKRRLEAEAHHLQERLLEEGERHREEVAALQGQIQKSLRDQSREGANLEYLKNVFFRFLTWTDLLGRQQMLNAILTILHFSPEERQAVLRHGGAGSHSWWHPGKR